MIPILVESIRNLINLIQTRQNIGKVFSQKCIPNQWSTRNFYVRTRTMQNISFHLQRWEIVGT